ncbi:MAG: HIT domain-containing protein [Syntrophales bacterium]|nr:HIT domain-containing protein [Syntrophales bacterium]MCK9527582.1 HIT domain-containing protein [Syntrophales bacterium]MDX9922199.1 HIT domain-containing protein [Syntrophales bacterium]
MESIIAPGRIRYVNRGKTGGCIFCVDSLRDESLVLHEGTSCYVIMNKYPYTSGHLMIAPYRHVARIGTVTEDELLELMKLTGQTVEVLTSAFSPEGFNIGLNMGRAAGAGYEDHLHLHVVPRWFGDTNFITVLGETRIIPEEIEKTRDLLRTLF